jgi:Flp pilus assembly protein TadG
MAISFDLPVRFARSERGSITILFSLMAIVLFGMIGAAVDFSRWHNANSRTAEALDNALLAAGRQLQTEPGDMEKALAAAETYFNNLTQTRLTVDNPTVSFNLADDGVSIEGKAHGNIKTPFLGLLLVHTLDVSADAKATLAIGSSSGGSNLEISLMLDVTGSMCSDGNGPCASSSKLDALKAAAKELVKIVVRDDASNGNAKVAIVPFSTRVRVGLPNQPVSEALMKKLTNMEPTLSAWFGVCTASSGGGGSETDLPSSCSNWDSQYFANTKLFPCVSDRTGPQEFTDAAPGSNMWLTAHDGTRQPLSWDSSDVAMTTGLGKSKSDPVGGWNYNLNETCADIGDGNIVAPLSSDKAMINQHIDGLQAYGATAGALGTAWAWYVLSPEWSSVWSGESVPGSYSDLTATSSGEAPKLRKIAVLMTDGMYNTFRTAKGQDPTMVSDRAKAICTNMKAKGIEIYTVGFELDQLSPGDRTRAKDVLQSCGTDLQHFYDAVDNDKLKLSFRDIAMKLATLFLAK